MNDAFSKDSGFNSLFPVGLFHVLRVGPLMIFSRRIRDKFGHLQDVQNLTL
ncbi:hypothetical protein Hanom_Chr12g01176561 [Helianthus anomalus]